MNKLELIEKRNQYKADIESILSAGESEMRKLNDGETADIAEKRKQIEDIDIKLVELEKLNEKLNKKDKNKFERKMEKFSLLKTINAIANNQPLDDRALEVIAQGKEEMRASGVSHQGQIQIPVSEGRSLTVTAENEVVAEDKMNIMPALRNQSVLGVLGATFLTGLRGDVSIPKYSGSAVTWEGETASAKDGEGTIDSVKYSPKRLTAKIDISKQFLIQDSVGAEEMLKSDLVNAIMEKLEATLLGDAAGTATMPAGLFNIVTPSASVDSYIKVVELESQLESNKVLGEVKFAVSPSAKAKYKTTPTFAGGNQSIAQGAEIDGITYHSTGNIPMNHIALGKWSDYVIAQFGGFDLTIDPYSQASNGMVRIVINAYFDGKPRRNESFVTGKTVANA